MVCHKVCFRFSCSEAKHFLQNLRWRDSGTTALFRIYIDRDQESLTRGVPPLIFGGFRLGLSQISPAFKVSGGYVPQLSQDQDMEGLKSFISHQAL